MLSTKTPEMTGETVSSVVNVNSTDPALLFSASFEVTLYLYVVLGTRLVSVSECALVSVPLVTFDP